MVFQIGFRRRIEKKDRAQTEPFQRFHDVGGAGEIVAVIGNQLFRKILRRDRGAGMFRGHRNFPNVSMVWASDGWVLAYSANGMPRVAASQACCNPWIPAAGPPGCAMT